MKKELLKLLSNGYWEPDMCPVCGGDVIVTGPKPKKGQPGYRRRKQCLSCKVDGKPYAFYTVEVLEEALKKPLAS